AGPAPARAAAAAGPGRPGAGTSAPLARRGVPGAPEAGEDLPPDRVVPVAERAAAGHRIHRPGAAAQHLVLRTEEHLGVLPVRKGDEPRVPGEVARGPLPYVADQLPHPVRRGTGRVAADRGRAKPGTAQVGQLRGGILVAPRIAAGPPGHRVVPGGLLPLRFGG